MSQDPLLHSLFLVKKKGESSQVTLLTDLKLNLLKVVSIGKRICRRIYKIEKHTKK